MLAGSPGMPEGKGWAVPWRSALPSAAAKGKRLLSAHALGSGELSGSPHFPLGQVCVVSCAGHPETWKAPALTRVSLYSHVTAWLFQLSLTLSVLQLTLGGKAAQAGVGVGDWVLYIDGESTSAMTHIEAQNRIRACGDRLCLTLSR